MHSRSAQAKTRKKPQEHEQETKNTKHTTMYPASGPSCGGNTPTAALAYSLYISSGYKYRVLLELYEEQW